METQAERDRVAERRLTRSRADAEQRGETLLDLVIADHDVGLGGHTLLTFVKRNRTQSLPWNRFRIGSPVLISADDTEASESVAGIVSKRNSESIQVATDNWPDGDRFRIDLSADEITHLRQLSAMNRALDARGRFAQLRDVLLGIREPQFLTTKVSVTAPALNESQREAIEFALSAKDLAIIHGPPGTGKTTTVVELAFKR